jgi:hypothetical protein
VYENVIRDPLLSSKKTGIYDPRSRYSLENESASALSFEDFQPPVL